MIRTTVLLSFAAVAFAGCTSNPNANRDINCAAGVVGAAAVGGLVGNQVGKGTGNTIATAAGASAGAVAGNQRETCR